MSNTPNPRYSQNIFLQQTQSAALLRPRSGVRQDKTPPGRETADRTQPHTASTAAGDRHPKHHGSEKRQTDSVSGRIPAQLKIELGRIANQNGWSESYTVKTAIEEFVENSLGQKFGARVSAIVTKAIDTRTRARDNRLVALLVRIAFETGQIRGIVTNHLAIEPGITNENVRLVLDESAKEAKANITRRTPQIAEILEELKQWLTDEEEHHQTASATKG